MQFRTFLYPALLSLWFNTVSAQKFNVKYSAGTQSNFTGNVFLYLSKDNRNPGEAEVGMESFPCYRIAVKNVKPNQVVTFDDAAISYPVALTDIERGEYYVEAIWDNSLGGRSIANSAGNLYNKPARLNITKDRNRVFDLVCKEVIPEQTFKETEYSKEMKVSSQLLTAFYKRPTTINAAVWLPKEYSTEPGRRFPVLYWVSGYGGDYHRFSGRDLPATPIDTTACIKVFLDGNCPLGHSVYTNSENNGPWGDALVKELIPQVEKNYRCNGARLLNGHSSGGWTVLSLQTRYPDVFTACWSSSPDPVDFRNFQRIDLYNDKSMFYGKDSMMRMTATVAGSIPWATMKQAYAMENVVSRGEQMRSFDAVFSQPAADGTPRPLCDYRTGVIDPVTVEHWKKYDLSLYLRNHWDELKNNLKGKVRVSVGEQDNFLLNYAVHMLDAEMNKKDAGFQFAYYPGDHFTVSSSQYRKDGENFLEEKYNEYLKQKSASPDKH